MHLSGKPGNAREGKKEKVALRWGSQEELYRPLPFTFNLYTERYAGVEYVILQ